MKYMFYYKKKKLMSFFQWFCRKQRKYNETNIKLLRSKYQSLQVGSNEYYIKYYQNMCIN